MLRAPWLVFDAGRAEERITGVIVARVRQPLFLVPAIVVALIFVLTGLTFTRFRVGRTADDPKYLPLRRAVGRRVAIVGATVSLALGLLLAFVA